MDLDLFAFIEETIDNMTWEEVLEAIESVAEGKPEDMLNNPPPAPLPSSPPNTVAGQDFASKSQTTNSLRAETCCCIPVGAAPCCSEGPHQLVAAPGRRCVEDSASATYQGPPGPMQAGLTPADCAAPSLVSNTMSEHTAFEAELKEVMASLPSLTDDIPWYSPPSSPPRPIDSAAPSVMMTAVPEHDEQEVGVGANPQLWNDISGATSNYPPPTSPPSSAPVCVLGKQNCLQPQLMENQSIDCHPQPVALPGMNVGHCTPIMYQGQVTITQSDFASSGSGAPPMVSIKRKRTDQDNGPYIKKPLNAFMVYRKEQRPYVAAELNISNSGELNKVLGQKWRSLSPEEQDKYYEAAEREKLFHILQHPNWSSKDNYGKKRKREGRKNQPGGEDDTQTAKKQCVTPVQTAVTAMHVTNRPDGCPLHWNSTDYDWLHS